MYVIQCINWDRFTDANWITKEKKFKSKLLAMIYRRVARLFHGEVIMKEVR